MGTRNLTLVVQGGQSKVAQYGQWDGYPEGQGKTVLTFARKIRKPAVRAKFIERLAACRFITDAEAKADERALSKVPQQLRDEHWKNSRPFLTRDHGADVLNLILDSKGDAVLRDSSSFAADSLFCEWAYVIDLDQNTLEVYAGFNKEPVPAGERFANLEPEKDAKGVASEYFPIRHLVTFKLDALPRDLRDFCRSCNRATKALEKRQESTKATEQVG